MRDQQVGASSNLLGHIDEGPTGGVLLVTC